MSALNSLALDGGMPRLAPGRVAAWPQFTSDDDIEILHAANRAAHAGMVARTDAEPSSRGLHRGAVLQLERRWAATVGRTDVVACASGTVAVRLLAAGLELEPGDEIIVPAGSTAAAAIAAAGLEAVPVDLDHETLQIDPAAVEAAITERTRAIVAVDLHGTTPDHRRLGAIAARHHLAHVEDGSQSIGASLDRRPVGSHGETSLCVLPSGSRSRALGAGALYATDDSEQGATARRVMLIDDPFGAGPIGLELFGAEELIPTGGGTMAGLDAGLALDRLAALDDDIATRSANGTQLRRALETLPGIRLPELVRGATHVYTTFPLLVVPDELGLPESAAPMLRDTIVDCMTAEGLWIDSARHRVCPSDPGHRNASSSPNATIGDIADLPVLDHLLAAGLVFGRRQSPFAAPNGPNEMDRIADCFDKILTDNLDRVRQLTLERARVGID